MRSKHKIRATKTTGAYPRRIFSLHGSWHRTYYRRFAKDEADTKLAILLILVLIAAIGCGSTYIAGLLSMG